jgi:copine 1/2/3
MPKAKPMKLELSLHASNLKNVIMGSFGSVGSDPFCVVTHMGNDKAVVLGKTETILNSISPDFTKVFLIDGYTLGTPMKLIVSIFHDDKSGATKPKTMGIAVFEVGEILGAHGCTKAKRIPNGGTIFAHVRPAVTSAGVLRLQLEAVNLINTEGFMRKPDPFFELSRRIDSAGAQTWDNIHRSETKSNTLNPTWDAAVLDVGMLCGGNLDTPIKIAIYDFEANGKHVIMGCLETTVNALAKLAKGATMDLTVKGKTTGQLRILRAELELSGGVATATEQLSSVSIQSKDLSPQVVPPSFLDYVAGGCHLNCIVAIDFTGSNGDPRKPGTLHHVDPHSNNPYEKAIDAIVSILAKYDTDQSFPVVGFGAKFNGVVEHCFQVGPKEEAHGVSGVLDAYRSVFSTGLILSSPTDFTAVMSKASQRASAALSAAQERGQLAYTILLIVTDGAVSNIPSTAACLKQISDSPLSIVIVAVGDADFGPMQFLDDLPGIDRDFVQFVQFNTTGKSRDTLTDATLREIPDQLTDYFWKRRGIEPGRPVVAEEQDVVVADEEEEIDLSLDFSESDIVIAGGGIQSREIPW